MEILIDDASPQFEYVSAGQQPQGISGTWHNAYQSEGQYGPCLGRPHWSAVVIMPAGERSI